MVIKAEKANKEGTEKRRRARAAAGWGLIISMTISFLIVMFDIIWGNVKGPQFINWGAISFILWMLIYFAYLVIPVTLLSMIIGSRTKPPDDFVRTSVKVTLVITAVYMSIFTFLFNGNGISLIIRLTELLSGIFLGLVTSYAFWHAGRNKS